MADDNRLTYYCNDKKPGMTLGELQQIVESATSLGAQPTSLIKISIGFSRQIQVLEVLVDRTAPPVLWPVVTFSHNDKEWVLPNLANAPMGLAAASMSGDIPAFLDEAGRFGGEELRDAMSDFSPEEFGTFLDAWGLASRGM